MNKKKNQPRSGGPSNNARARMRAEELAAQRRKKRLTVIIAVIVVVVLIVGAGALYGYWQTNKSVEVSGKPTIVGEHKQQLAKQDSSGDGALIWGNGDKVIDLYADFNCPHCVEFEKEFGPTFQQAVESGKWKLRMHYLSFISPQSMPMTNSAACAAADGFGWNYQKALFANPGKSWDDKQFFTLAEQVSGSTPDSFRSCVQRLSYRGVIEANTKYAFETQKIPGTPFLKIDGKEIPLQGISVKSLKEKLGL